MSSSSRRDFLKQALASATICGLQAPLRSHAQTASMHAAPEPGKFSSLPRFVDPLHIPRLLPPTATRNGANLYRIRMTEFTQRLHSSLPPTRLWGYEGQYPGPSIQAFRGQPVEIEWENHLPLKHLFEIDLHIHGAMAPTPAVRTVPHLHGAHTSSASDGLPEKWFTPGHSASYTYPNDQRASTLWYHDHAVGITRLNVYAGLSGFYLLRDQEEQSLGLPDGDYEIPLLLHDRTLDDAGQLVYAPTHDDGLKLPPGVWGPEFFGSLPVINGVIYPYLDVEPRPYRLRLLNGSNSRFFGLHFNLAKSATDIPSYVTFSQIGSDGGLLQKPARLNEVLLGPAERADIVIDFSDLEGKVVTLSNGATSPYPGWGMMAMHAPPMLDLMQFRVTVPRKGPAKSFSVNSLSKVERLNEAEAVTTRDLLLIERIDPQGRSLGVRINDKGYDDPITETVKLGTMEKWRFINTTEDAHPMHLHLVQFQILHRQGFDAIALRKDGTIKLVGTVRHLPEHEAGWKDTAVVLPGEVLTILVPFEGFKGRYVFHCHMLEHEDNDMMRPYEVVE